MEKVERESDLKMSNIPEGCVAFDANRAIAGHPVMTKGRCKLKCALHDVGNVVIYRLVAPLIGRDHVCCWDIAGNDWTGDPCNKLLLIAPAPGPNPSWVTPDEIGEGWELCEPEDGEEYFGHYRTWIRWDTENILARRSELSWRRRKVEPKKPKLRPPTPQELLGAWIRNKAWPTGCGANVTRTYVRSFDASCFSIPTNYNDPGMTQNWQRTAPGSHPSEGKWIDWMVEEKE